MAVIPNAVPAGVLILVLNLFVSSSLATPPLSYHMHVSVGGEDTPECGGLEAPCASVCFAIDALEADINQAPSETPVEGFLHIGGGVYEVDCDPIDIHHNEATLTIEGVAEDRPHLHFKTSSRSAAILIISGATYVAVKGIALHGSPVNHQRCLAVSGHAIEIFDVHFEGCAVGDPVGHYTGGGCAVFEVAESLAIDESDFRSCHSSESGGALEVWSSSSSVDVSIAGSAFHDSRADDSGGCVVVRDVDSLIIEDGRFSGCDAAESGGAVAVISSDSVPTELLVSYTTFANSSANSGGCLGVQYEMDVSATGHEGTVSAHEITFVGVTFSSCVAGVDVSGHGGALYVVGVEDPPYRPVALSATNITVLGCKSRLVAGRTAAGGAMFFRNVDVLEIEDSILSQAGIRPQDELAVADDTVLRRQYASGAVIHAEEGVRRQSISAALRNVQVRGDGGEFPLGTCITLLGMGSVVLQDSLFDDCADTFAKITASGNLVLERVVVDFDRSSLADPGRLGIKSSLYASNVTLLALEAASESLNIMLEGDNVHVQNSTFRSLSDEGTRCELAMNALYCEVRDVSFAACRLYDYPKMSFGSALYENVRMERSGNLRLAKASLIMRDCEFTDTTLSVGSRSDGTARALHASVSNVVVQGAHHLIAQAAMSRASAPLEVNDVIMSFDGIVVEGNVANYVTAAHLDPDSVMPSCLSSGISLHSARGKMTNFTIRDNALRATAEELQAVYDISGLIASGLCVFSSRVSLSNGSVSSNIGATGVMWGQLSEGELAETTIQGNIASGDVALGGGLGLMEGPVVGSRGTVFRALDIIDNQTPGNGGGVYVHRARNVSIIDSVITRNHANEGGGIFAVEALGQVLLEHTEVTENTAVASGGGVSVLNGQGYLGVRHSVVRDNVAHVGGGIAILGDASRSDPRKFMAVSVTTATIASNRAERGGGVFVNGEQDSISFADSIFETNEGAGSDFVIDGEPARLDSVVGLDRCKFMSVAGISSVECGGTLPLMASSTIFVDGGLDGKCAGNLYKSSVPPLSEMDQCTPSVEIEACKECFDEVCIVSSSRDQCGCWIDPEGDAPPPGDGTNSYVMYAIIAAGVLVPVALLLVLVLFFCYRKRMSEYDHARNMFEPDTLGDEIELKDNPFFDDDEEYNL